MLLRLLILGLLVGFLIVGPSFWLLCHSWKALKHDDYVGSARLFVLFVIAHERERFASSDVLSWFMGSTAKPSSSTISWAWNLLSWFF